MILTSWVQGEASILVPLAIIEDHRLMDEPVNPVQR
jgi:hypothetical protein